MVRLQVIQRSGQISYQRTNEWLLLLLLLLNKHVLRELGQFKECFRSHVLDTRMLLSHEFLQFVYNSFKESPM